VREKLIGYWYGPELNAFDLQLMPLAVAFGDKVKLGERIEAFVRRSPALLDHMQAHRSTIAEDQRLRWLQLALWREVDIYGSVARMDADLARLPEDYRILLLMGLFAVEFGNGGMHQLFFNSTGAAAPGMQAAFATLGLKGQAAVLIKALAMFAAPYERDTTRRRSRYFQSGESPWDDALHALTDEFEAVEGEPPYQQAVLAFARARGLLPR
jgi:hypothetical protein